MALFSKQSQAMAKQSNQATPAQVNMIGEDTVIEGSLRAKGGVQISGTVVGKVVVEGKVTILSEGSVDGELTAQNAHIAGRVEGKLMVKELVVITGSGRVEADIQAGRLVMEEGAVFNGNCNMGAPGTSAAQPNGVSAKTNTLS